MRTERMSARQIVGETVMSARPEFYSGSGARVCDLSDRELERIYGGIQREHGEEAAKQYAQMVADIPKLTATDFLLTLYKLEANDWRWKEKLVGKEDGIYVDGQTDAAKVGSAMVTVISVLDGMNTVDETHAIRREFLARHGVKEPSITPKYSILLPKYDSDDSK